ncbi:C-signal-like [Scyliorhinus torazame]|uniref:C-signal-like n=1 Tax=Scyliorhinus torazame TaxID=75743 RepID=UPI003B5BE85D
MIELDVTDSANIQKAVEAVETSLGTTGLNLLINNAGINSYATLETLTAEDMMAVFRTNVVGPLLVSKAFLPSLKKAAQALHLEGMSCNKAAIVNITSLLGSIQLSRENFTRAPMYPYRLSKAALNMASMCLSEDLKQYQILCTAVHPGWVQTDMGGMEAPMPVTDSVSSILKVLSSLSQRETGKFLDWEGKEIDW